MAAVKKDVDRFIDAPPPQVFLFLLHGPDSGLVRERALRLAANRVDDRRDPFQFIEMSGDAVAADPLILLDEANSVPMFGGRRAILVELAKSIAPALEKLLAAPPQDCSVIVTAGALKWDAALRKLVEGAKFGAAIECQADSEQDIKALIGTTLREAGLQASPEALGLLQAALGEDRLMSRAELAKLVTYMHGRSRVEAADVENIVAHAANLATDRIVFEAFSGKAEAAGLGFEQIMAQGADATQLIVTALRYALALHRGRIAPGGGVQQTKRGGFYALPDAIIDGHLKNWSSAKLAALIEPLRAAQTRARAHADTARMEASRSLLRIAQEARNR